MNETRYTVEIPIDDTGRWYVMADCQTPEAAGETVRILLALPRTTWPVIQVRIYRPAPPENSVPV